MKNKIIVVAAAIIKDRRLFVARRAAELKHGGLWELPGGKVELGEGDETALKREIREELSLAIRVHEFIAESEVELSERIIHMRVYRCSVEDLTCLQCSDHSEVLWIQKSELLKLAWAPADIPILDALSELL